jgi:exopolyphosphatase/pppGpp-phosphohydrolase
MSMSQTAAPLAAIDVGSNTIHLVIASPVARGTDLVILVDETELVRLGADVTATGAIGPERAARAIGVLRRQAEAARARAAFPLLGIATEGVRMATNGAAFIQQARDEAGVELTLISGEQEAALTFWGATSGRPVDGRSAVVDLGGGSLELVVGDAAEIAWRVSLPLGSGAIHDRLATADPADPAELAAAAHVVDTALRSSAPPLPVREVVACGGSATTLAFLAQRVLGVNPDPGPLGAPADPWALPALTHEVIEALLGLLETLPAAEMQQRYGVEVDRARLLAVGAIILRAAMRRMGAERLRVTRRGIREGAILAYVRHGSGWLEAAARG